MQEMRNMIVLLLSDCSLRSCIIHMQDLNSVGDPHTVGACLVIMRTGRPHLLFPQSNLVPLCLVLNEILIFKGTCLSLEHGL